MVLRLISRSPRRSGLFVTVVSRVFSQDLTPASRRQNHTTSPSASAPFVKCVLAASTASRPASVTIASAPLWDGTANHRTDLGRARTEIFLQMGLDRQTAERD